jgi:membrane-anchored protein YejM (alkaline phosphatase superfamily)
LTPHRELTQPPPTTRRFCANHDTTTTSMSDTQTPSHKKTHALLTALRPVALFCIVNVVLWGLIAIRFPLVSSYRPDTLGAAFSIAALIGHFAMVGLFIFLLFSIFRFFPKHLYTVLAVTFTSVFTAFLLIDTFVLDLHKQHLSPALVGMFFSPAGLEVFTFPPLMWVLCVLAAAAIIALEIFLIHRSTKINGKTPKIIFKTTIPVFLVCILFFNAVYAWASFTGYNPVLLRAESFPYLQPLSARKLMKKLGFKQAVHLEVPQDEGSLFYPLNPIRLSANSEKPLNVLFLFVDSWRADSLNKETIPRLFEKTKEALVFSNHVSGGNATRCGLFSLFYGIPATYWHSFLAAGKRPVFMETLAKQNYTFAIYAAANLTNPEFDQTIFREIPNLRISTPGEDTVERDTNAEKEFLAFIETRDKTKPFFGFLFYDALHAFALPPNPKLPFLPSAEGVNFLALNNDMDPTPMRNLYKNAAYNMDIAIGNLLETLEKKGVLENTIVVLTGDHGQEVNETKTNAWGHNSNYSEFQIKVPLFILWPGRKTEHFGHLTTHFDIVPTLMREVLGVQNPLSDYSSGKVLFDSAKRDGFVMASYSSTAILHDGSVQVLKKYGIGENKTFDYSKEGTSLSGSVLRQALSEMKRFRKPENSTTPKK